MYFKIADLIVDIPAAGEMHSRCEEYIYNGSRTPDIVINATNYREDVWPNLNYPAVCYMESGMQFYGHMVKFNGIMLHSSAVELDGRAYLFSGPSGMGKSTHTRLWQQIFGSAAQIFNDDKPALRCIDGKWYAYGTPWCGKDGINQNKKVPLGGICFLKRGDTNKIRQMSAVEAIPKIIGQTQKKFWKAESLNFVLDNVEQLVTAIPIFELQNRPEPEAAYLSYETMHKKAEAMGL